VERKCNLTFNAIFQGQKEGSPYGGEEAEFVWEQFPYTAFSKVRIENFQITEKFCSCEFLELKSDINV